MLPDQDKNEFPFSVPSFELPTEKEEKEESFKTFIWETIKIIIISLIIILPVRHYLIQPFYVKGQSMEPNFHDNEYLIIDEISYRFNQPARGEIVVLRYPQNPSEYYIKRIIGLPGERLVIDGGRVKIYNQEKPGGFILDESSYLADGVFTAGNVDLILKDDEYYVLGDNRESSKDSRYFGPLKREFIIGRTWLRGWPISRFKVFKEPIYN